MSTLYSMVSPVKSASRAIARPPLPAADRSASARLFDDTDEDIRRLTADISRVLTGKPDLRIVGSPTDQPGMFGGGVPVLAADEEAAHPFEWQQASTLAETPRTADQAAGWLSRARQERRHQRLRAALSWCVALGIAAAIIAAVAGTVRGGAVLLAVAGEVGRTFGL